MTIKKALNRLIEKHGGKPSVNGDLSDALDCLCKKMYGTTFEEVTVECYADEEITIDGFPEFTSGDLVKIKVDGVEYSLEAYTNEYGLPSAGDPMFGNVGERKYGWGLTAYEDGSVAFMGMDGNTHYVSYDAEVVHPIDKKYLPEALQFGEETITVTDTLTWDGNTDGLVSVSGHMGTYYKVSDIVLTKDDFPNGASLGGVEVSAEVSEGNFVRNNGVGFFETAVFAPYNESFLLGMSFPEAGIYFLKNETYFLDYLTINGYKGFESTQTVVKQLDGKYLPKIDFISDLTSAPTAQDFNNLLWHLREYGYMAAEQE